MRPISKKGPYLTNAVSELHGEQGKPIELVVSFDEKYVSVRPKGGHTDFRLSYGQIYLHAVKVFQETNNPIKHRITRGKL